MCAKPLCGFWGFLDFFWKCGVSTFLRVVWCADDEKMGFKLIKLIWDGDWRRKWEIDFFVQWYIKDFSRFLDFGYFNNYLGIVMLWLWKKMGFKLIWVDVMDGFLVWCDFEDFSGIFGFWLFQALIVKKWVLHFSKLLLGFYGDKLKIVVVFCVWKETFFVFFFYIVIMLGVVFGFS